VSDLTTRSILEGIEVGRAIRGKMCFVEHADESNIATEVVLQGFWRYSLTYARSAAMALAPVAVRPYYGGAVAAYDSGPHPIRVAMAGHNDKWPHPDRRQRKRP